jgi:hypothetical protein
MTSDHSPTSYSQYLGPLAPQAILPYSPRFCGPGVYLQRHTLRDRRPSTAAYLQLTEIVYGEEKMFCTGPTRAAGSEQKSLVPALQYKPNEPTKKEPLSFVRFESPFTSEQSAEATPL